MKAALNDASKEQLVVVLVFCWWLWNLLPPYKNKTRLMDQAFLPKSYANLGTSNLERPNPPMQFYLRHHHGSISYGDAADFGHCFSNKTHFAHATSWHFTQW